MELCIGGGGEGAPGGEDGEGFVAGVADFAHLYTDRPTALMLLCEFILNTLPPVPSAGAPPGEGAGRAQVLVGCWC